MSRGDSFARFRTGLAAALEVTVGPVHDDPCDVGRCSSEAAFRVPWPSVGGDIAYCDYHLARYREQHPDLFDHVQDVVDEDLTAYATRGTRFLSLDAVPETLFDEEFQAIALLVDGTALFEEIDPDGEVVYVAVDRSLEEESRTTVPRGNAGEFLAWVDERLGVHEWDSDVEKALYGGESA